MGLQAWCGAGASQATPYSADSPLHRGCHRAEAKCVGVQPVPQQSAYPSTCATAESLPFITLCVLNRDFMTLP